MSTKEESTHYLSPFEKKDVRTATIKITNTGDGLTQNMAIEPVEFHLGWKGMVLVEVECVKVDYSPISAKAADVLQRNHTFKASIATIIDTPAAKKAIEAQRVKIEKHGGKSSLPGLGSDDGDGDGDNGDAFE